MEPKSFIESINLIRENIDNILGVKDLFSQDVVDKIGELSGIDLSPIIADLHKGNYLGNRKIDIDLSLNNASTTDVPTYKQADIVLVSGVKLEIPFDNGSGGILELSSHTDIKAYIQSHLLYAQVVDTEMVVYEAFAGAPTILRVRDADGKASNIERIELHSHSGSVVEIKPSYFWAKTTSSLETLANRAGDIIQLGNDIDSIVTLSQRIDELISLQGEIASLLQVHANLASIVTVASSIGGIASLSTRTAAIDTINTNINALIAINTNLTEILAADENAAVATQQATLSTNKASEAAAAALTATQQATIATQKANEIKGITAQATTLIPGSLATATYNPVDGKLTFGIPQGSKGDRGEAFKVNAMGQSADRALYDTQPKDFSFFDLQVSLLYFKNSDTAADWSAGIPFGKGDTGATGATGNGIASVVKISGTGAPGTADTYRITMTDTSTFDFQVWNGTESVVSVAGKTGVVILVKGDVGLGNVDNTSDIAKPISTATQAALDGKAPATHNHDDLYFTEAELALILAQKQDTLQSGVNLRTINGESLLGSTDLIISGNENLVLTTTIGTPGALGFGVGIANGSLAAAMGLYPMPGYNDVTSENYGNYIDLHGSVMVFVPKFYHKITNDTAAPYYGTKVEVSDTEATGFVINRAFVNNGAIQDGFFIDKYLCGNVGGKFIGMRGIDPVSTGSAHNPIASITGVTLGNRYDAIFQAVKSRGSGYAVPSMFMYNAIGLLTLAHAQAATPATAAWMDVAPYAPKGCNDDNLGDTNDISIKYVSAGNATYPKAPLNASCSDTAFAKITHNGQKCGITDINGNMWEIASGFIQSTADAFWTLKTTIDIKNLTGVVVTDATDNWNTANYDSLTLPFTPNETQTTFGNGTSAVFSGNTDTASNAYRLDAAGVPLAMGGAPARFGGDGLWQYSTASMCPFVGGGWDAASAAGVWARAWIYARSTTSVGVGGRACLIGS